MAMAALLNLSVLRSNQVTRVPCVCHTYTYTHAHAQIQAATTTSLRPRGNFRLGLLAEKPFPRPSILRPSTRSHSPHPFPTHCSLSLQVPIAKRGLLVLLGSNTVFFNRVVLLRAQLAATRPGAAGGAAVAAADNLAREEQLLFLCSAILQVRACACVSLWCWWWRWEKRTGLGVSLRRGSEGGLVPCCPASSSCGPQNIAQHPQNRTRFYKAELKGTVALDKVHNTSRTRGVSRHETRYVTPKPPRPRDDYGRNPAGCVVTRPIRAAGHRVGARCGRRDAHSRVLPALHPLGPLHVARCARLARGLPGEAGKKPCAQ